MHVLSLQGSPRKDGNTAAVLGCVEEGLAKGGHVIDRVDIVDCEIAGCDECLTCQQGSDAPDCAILDDANEIFQKMVETDLIVFASPVFCWGFSAQLKALLDRSICLCKMHDDEPCIPLLRETPMALVATAAGPEDGNMDLIAETFSRYVRYMRGRQAGQLLVPRCTTPSDLPEDVEERAQAFAASLGNTVGYPRTSA